MNSLAAIVRALTWTTEHFGNAARERYENPLSSALAAILTDPERIGSAARPELGDGVRSFHLMHVKRGSKFARPRHMVLYHVSGIGTIAVGRVLHDAMEMERHARIDFPPEL